MSNIVFEEIKKRFGLGEVVEETEEFKCSTVKPKEAFDVAEFCSLYEKGKVTAQELIERFQHLINSGIVWSLQGRYGRMAKRLIGAGYCHEKED